MPAKINPVLCASLGAAFSFYCLLPLYRSDHISINVFLVFLLLPVAVLCLFRVLASWPVNSAKLKLMPVYLTAFAAGLALGAGAGTRVTRNVSFGVPEKSVLGVSGVLLDDPRIVSGGRVMSALSLRQSTGKDGARVSASGEISVFFPEESASRLKEFGRKTTIYTEGNLRKSSVSPGSYILTSDSVHITKPAPLIERFRTGLRLDLASRFGSSAEGGLAQALLLGIRDNLDTGFTSLYRNAGCSYLLALSGLNLAVLIALISFFLKKPLGMRAAAVSGSLIIIIYCFLVGPLPSLNRAALMYILGVIAILGMLKKEPFSLLCMAFLIQIAFTPQAGMSISFMLSYLGLLGILLVGGIINNIFKGMIPPVLLNSVSASLGAFIATSSITAWFFGDLRPIGIAVSLVLAPLAMVFMIFALVWLALGSAFPVLSPLLEKPLALLYWLMEKTAFLASRVPGIKLNPYLVLFLSLAFIILLAVFYFRNKSARHFRGAFK